MRDLLTLLSLIGWAGGLTYKTWRNGQRLTRIEYWISVHHSLIPTGATPEQVKRRGTWR